MTFALLSRPAAWRNMPGRWEEDSHGSHRGQMNEKSTHLIERVGS